MFKINKKKQKEQKENNTTDVFIYMKFVIHRVNLFLNIHFLHYIGHINYTTNMQVHCHNCTIMIHYYNLKMNIVIIKNA